MRGGRRLRSRCPSWCRWRRRGRSALDAARAQRVRLRAARSAASGKRPQRRVLAAAAAHRQLERAPAGRQRERDRLGRGPDDRPVAVESASRRRWPAANACAAFVELQADRLAPARLQRLRILVAVAMRQVEQAVGDARRGAVRRDVAKPRRTNAFGLSTRHVERRPPARRGSRGARRAARYRRQRAAVLVALVARQVGAQAVRRTSCRRPGRWSAASDRDRRPPPRARRRLSRPGVEDAAPRRDARRRPGWLGDPAAGPLVVVGAAAARCPASRRAASARP